MTRPKSILLHLFKTTSAVSNMCFESLHHLQLYEKKENIPSGLSMHKHMDNIYLTVSWTLLTQKLILRLNLVETG